MYRYLRLPWHCLFGFLALVFYLEYHKYYKDAALFMQEVIFDLYESDVKQKKQNYLTAVTELQKYIDPSVPTP